MGTALVLLFLLALGAIPGALLPQRSLNAGQGRRYLAEHPIIGPWLDRLQAFDVFSSFWFTAIYVLLFISLVGCLTPRMVEHVRSLRAVAGRRAAEPVPAAQAPRPSRSPASRDVAAECRERLPGWRRRHPDASGRHRRSLRREGLSARVRQHRLPLLAARPAGRHRGGQAVRLRGQRHRHRRRRARFLLGIACRLRLVPGGQHRRRHLAASDLPAGQRLRRTLSADRAGRCRSPPTSTTRPART